MKPFSVVFTDLTWLSILLLIGYMLRKNCKWIQNLYLPAALLGGIVGLLLGPQVLGKYTSYCLPMGKSVAEWSGILVTLVFSVQFLGTEPVDFNEAALSGFCVAGIGHMVQTVAGLLCAAAFIPYYKDLPFAFGLTPVYGFYGGHGTAAAAGQAFAGLGWADGLAVSNTMATAGLIVGIVVGMIIINIGVRRGYTKFALKPSDLPKELREGFVPLDKRESIGYGVTCNDVIDPFAFQLAIACFICFCAYKVNAVFHKIPIPAFAWGLILGFVAWEVLKKLKMTQYVDRKTLNRVAGVAMEYLICSAIATLNLGIFQKYLLPIITEILLMTVVSVVFYCYFGSKLYQHDWFERTVGSFGQGCGVLPTGLMLIRVIDPELQTTGAGCLAAASVLGYIVSMPYLAFGPAIAYSWNHWAFIGFSFVLLIGFIVAGRIFFWKKSK